MSQVARSVTLAASAALLCGVLVPLAASQASAASCISTPTLLSHAPSKSQALAQGVQLRSWRSRGLQVTAVTVDLNTAPVRPVVQSGSLTSTYTVSQYANSNAKDLAVVNGDYFNYSYLGSNGQYAAMLVQNAQIHSGVAQRVPAGATPVVGFGSDGKMHGAQVTASGAVTLANPIPKGTKNPRKVSVPVAAVNDDQVPSSGVVVYTTQWGTNVRPRGHNEVTIKNGVVTSTTRARSGGVPSGSVVLAANGRAATALAQLRTGDHVNLAYGAKSDTGVTFTDALGRGSYMAYNGKTVAGCAPIDEVYRPRTVIGWDATGKHLILMTATDGSNSSFGYLTGGLTYHQTGDIMRQLGAYDAVMVDGGGSTTLVTRQGSNVSRQDKGPNAYERPVPNAFAIQLR